MKSRVVVVDEKWLAQLKAYLLPIESWQPPEVEANDGVCLWTVMPDCRLTFTSNPKGETVES